MQGVRCAAPSGCPCKRGVLTTGAPLPRGSSLPVKAADHKQTPTTYCSPPLPCCPVTSKPTHVHTLNQTLSNNMGSTYAYTTMVTDTLATVLALKTPLVAATVLVLRESVHQCHRASGRLMQLCKAFKGILLPCNAMQPLPSRELCPAVGCNLLLPLLH